jgi:hypothetical protein
LLFDGQSFSGWKTFRSTSPPKSWWVVEGQLRGDAGGSYLATVADFEEYELSFEFRGTPDANSGVNYCVDEIQDSPSKMGPEFELDADAPTTGMMWDVGPPSGLVLNTLPPGWYRGQLTVSPGRARHVFADPTGKVLFDKTYDRNSDEFRNSNKGGVPGFWPDRGKLTLQAMNGSVAFRNLKIRATK